MPIGLRPERVDPTPPSVPSGVYLPPMFSIIEPITRVNMVQNPSVEIDIVGWDALSNSTAARDRSNQYAGHWSVAITPSVAGTKTFGTTFGFSGYTIPVITGSTYALTVYVYGVAGVRYKIHFSSNGALEDRGQPWVFYGTGRWQRTRAIIWKSTVSANVCLTVKQDNQANQAAFYVDALQCELCETGNYFATTYIDGDRTPTTLNQTPPPFYWNGTRHASTSTRSGSTRAGGRVISLDQYGFQLLGIAGLGQVTPDIQSVQYAELDGEMLQLIRKPASTFTLIGRFDEETFRRLRARSADLQSILDRDLVHDEQPLKLLFQPMDECGRPNGDECEIVCTYAGGFEGSINNFNTDLVTISFRLHNPSIPAVREISNVQSKLSATTSIANIARRRALGEGITESWDEVGGTNATVYALARQSNGTWVVGGNFTAAGGGGSDYCATLRVVDPVTSIWTHLVGSDTTFNAAVHAIAINPSTGLVYIGGAFINAAGNANADRICEYNPVLDTLTNLGTGGLDGEVDAIAIIDNKVFVGGTFTQMGGVANTNSIAYWNLTALTWNAVGTGATTGSGVYAIAGRGSLVYAGGAFTGMGGVANTTRLALWNIDTSTWSAMSTGANNNVYALTMHPRTNGVYIGGAFTALDNITMYHLGLWNGANFEYVGPSGGFPFSAIASIRTIAIAPNGTIWVGGQFNGVVPTGWRYFTSGILRIVGGATVHGPIYQTNIADMVLALAFSPDSGVLAGWDTMAGLAWVPVGFSLTNTGNVRVYPKLFMSFTADATAGSQFFSIENMTTGAAIHFWNLQVRVNEEITINCDPRKITAWSSRQGDISGKIMAGSITHFYLQPGVNEIEVLANEPNTSLLYMRWQPTHSSIDNAWYQAKRGL